MQVTDLQELVDRDEMTGLFNRLHSYEVLQTELETTEWGSLDQVWTRADIVSINCPHTPGTYHLLSARRLKLLKPTDYIVNTARGEVIDENELARLIEAGAIAGAGLDVFEHEPAVNPKLPNSDRVVALPHMSSAPIPGRIALGVKAIDPIELLARRRQHVAHVCHRRIVDQDVESPILLA